MNAVQTQLRSTAGAANYGTAVRPRISCDQEPHGACAAALHESRTDEVKVERANGRECLAGSVKLAFLRVTWLVTAEAATIVSRSEERRVGKEGRRRRAGSA